MASKKDTKSHGIWRVLARDQCLLNDYVDYIFAEYQVRFAKNTSLEDIRAMGIFLGSCSGNNPEMRAWFVSGLEGGSGAFGRYDLDGYGGRFVGIAPEALSVSNHGASNIKSYTLTDLQNFDNAMKGLEKTVIPELLKPFAQLRNKL